MQRLEVMSGKYLIQYLFAAGGSASILPLIERIGIGAACTISKLKFGKRKRKENCVTDRYTGVVFVLIAGVFMVVVARWGSEIQVWWKKRPEQ